MLPRKRALRRPQAAVCRKAHFPVLLIVLAVRSVERTTEGKVADNWLKHAALLRDLGGLDYDAPALRLEAVRFACCGRPLGEVGAERASERSAPERWKELSKAIKSCYRLILLFAIIAFLVMDSRMLPHPGPAVGPGVAGWRGSLVTKFQPVPGRFFLWCSPARHGSGAECFESHAGAAPAREPGEVQVETCAGTYLCRRFEDLGVHTDAHGASPEAGPLGL